MTAPSRSFVRRRCSVDRESREGRRSAAGERRPCDEGTEHLPGGGHATRSGADSTARLLPGVCRAYVHDVARTERVLAGGVVDEQPAPLVDVDGTALQRPAVREVDAHVAAERGA